MNGETSAPVVTVAVLQLAHATGLPLPRYETADAAGLDLMAAFAEDAPVTLAPGHRVLAPTGLALRIPPGYEAQVRPRSGLALKHGLTILNSPGTIDADYRGEIGIILINLGNSPVTLARGMRIAQLVVAPVTRAVIVGVDVLEATERGDGGFGSTGS